MPAPVKTPEQMLDYLQTNVYRDEDCLTWAGSVSVNGNPRIAWAKRNILARRLLLELLGEPAGKNKITEKCGNKLCMNRSHFIVMSHRKIMQRAAKQGHWQVGAVRAMKAALGKAKTARLPITEARNVIQMRASGMKIKDICAKYGVDYRQLNRSEKLWRKVGIL